MTWKMTMTSRTEPSRRLVLDLETFSSADLPRGGVKKYTEAPDFEILLMSYAWDGGPVQLWDFTQYGPPDWLAPVLVDPAFTKIAWNVSFERNCLNAAFGIYTPPEQWRDAMTIAAMNGLPMSLDAAGAALQLQQQKLATGKALIRYFCTPCKPTISNKGRTRNLPEHAPDKWELFKEYCVRDTAVEQTIYDRLASFPVPEWERRLEALDARINERGVLVDMELAESAVAIDERSRAQNVAEMQEITGLDNPGSVAQLKAWLSTKNINVDSLNKATVSELLDTVTDPGTRRVLELRQLTGKTSTKKYQAILDAACADHRIRGLLQYYGAARTGRWAGRRVQLQNLAQNHLDNIGTVRELVRARDLETLELAYDSVPDVLSQLIRTALIAKPGHTFLVADYSAIEARVVAWMAGEQWRMDVFAQGGDIYCSSASQMFHVPVVKHGVNGHLRQKGKIAELACIAEGQPVLTDTGLVPIEQVTTDHRVWDGLEWVNHDGVVCRGEREVISYGGLEATADHLVWATLDGKSGPVQFGDAATSGAHLLQTGTGRNPVRVGDDHRPGKTMEQELEPLLRPDPVQRLWTGTMAVSGQPDARKIQRLPELFSASSGSPLAGQAFHSGKTALRESERRELQELRGAGDRVSVPQCDGRRNLHDRDERASRPEFRAGPDRRKRPLRAGESALGNASTELPESAQVSGKVRVYDILNAGPRHRFTVSGVLVHNCGYGGGVGALKAFGADKMGLSEDEMQTIVQHWRRASPTIPRFWSATERAARSALAHPGKTFSVQPCGVKYRRDADALRCKLPSGRILSYWGANIGPDGHLYYMGQNQTTRKWERTETWGGKLVENIVQAVARDCLAVALLRLDDAGFQTLFTVHDEVIVEEPQGGRTWQDVAEIMGQPIDWAPGLLLRGDGYETPFYMKD